MDEFDNQEDYRGKDKKTQTLTMRQIILEQVKKIMVISSDEIRGGYEEETIINIEGMPHITKKYIPDGRQAYCNAVLALEMVVTEFLVGEDNPKRIKLLEKIFEFKNKQKERYNQYLADLSDVSKNNGKDNDLIKYKYFSDKKRIYEDIFRQLLVILNRSGFENED